MAVQSSRLYFGVASAVRVLIEGLSRLSNAGAVVAAPRHRANRYGGPWSGESVCVGLSSRGASVQAAAPITQASLLIDRSGEVSIEPIACAGWLRWQVGVGGIDRWENND